MAGVRLISASRCVRFAPARSRRVAQQAERLCDMQEAPGAEPGATITGRYVNGRLIALQAVDASSILARSISALIAQLEERLHGTQEAAGSVPAEGSRRARRIGRWTEPSQGGVSVEVAFLCARYAGDAEWSGSCLPSRPERVRFSPPALWTGLLGRPTAATRRRCVRFALGPLAPVAQWTERPPSKRLCAGSIPARSVCTRRPTDRARGYEPRNGSSILSECV